MKIGILTGGGDCPGLNPVIRAAAKTAFRENYSMIGKLMAHGRNRGEAISILQRALEEFVIEPIKTTIPLHKEILKNPLFRRGQMHTDFIQRLMGDWPGKATEDTANAK